MAELLVAPARYVQLAAGTVRVGQLAGTGARHPFAPDGHTGTSCLACFGWCNDARHWGRPALPVGGGRGC